MIVILQDRNPLRKYIPSCTAKRHGFASKNKPDIKGEKFITLYKNQASNDNKKTSSNGAEFDRNYCALLVLSDLCSHYFIALPGYSDAQRTFGAPGSNPQKV